MDGDLAPIEDIVELAERHRVRLLVDESHAIGAVGPGGRGLLADLGLEDHVDVILGTLEKSLGSYGAFAACDRTMTQYLLNAARTLIFSTAPSPPAIAGAAAALALLEERPRLIARLQLNATALSDGLEQEGFGLNGSSTHIMSVVVGDGALTLRVCEAALSRGLFAQALVPPSVPSLGGRLRLTAMASHRAEELQAAARLLGKAAREVGFDPHSSVMPEPDVDLELDGLEQPEPEVQPAGLFDYERIPRAA
jgi:glycine C-acetyltransferase/8-amino-7-oxononanoate synthase